MKPKLICMTPVRNEAWCLDVFLRCTSLWADHIILADQNSTDGSIEIAGRYPKVTLIENKNEEYDEASRQKLLISEARKIDGPRILVALDSDEIFTSNFLSTPDWEKILQSNPGEVFGFQWANILPDQENYFPSSFYYPWMINDDGTEHNNYVKYIHSMRIPYPIEADMGYYKVKDFKVLHLAYTHRSRVISKNRFYQCVEMAHEANYSPVSYFRGYNLQKEKTYSLPKEWTMGYEINGIDIFKEIDLTKNHFWFDVEVIEYLKKYGLHKFRLLDIWDKEWISQMKEAKEIIDPRNFRIRILHFYLRSTQRFYPNPLVKAIDKMIKLVWHY